MPELHETKGHDWNVLAEEYANMTAKTSNKPISRLLQRANALKPFSEATGILDNGCGPGPVMARLIRDHGVQIPADCPLICADFSEGMVKQAQAMKEREVSAKPESPWSRAQTKVQNAMDLTDIASGSQSHVTAGFVYFMVPDPQKALSESLRVLQPSGVLALSSWESSQWLDLINLLPQIQPDKKMPTLPSAWSNADGLKAEMEKAGFKDVETHRVEVEMEFKTRESFAQFMLTKLPQMVALLKDMSEEEVERYRELWIREQRSMCASEPGTLQGVALVGVGRK